MKIGPLKTTMWYKCLVCHTCFQSPKGLVVHRMKSRCRFQYKEIHKERTTWPVETPLLESLDQDKALFLKDSKQLLKSQKLICKTQEITALEPTEQYSDEVKANVPELPEKSMNLDLDLVMNSDVRNQQELKYNCYFCSSLFTNFEDLENHVVVHTREESDEDKPESFNFDNCKRDRMKLNELTLLKTLTSDKFICNLCEKNYCSNQSLNLHISSVHKKLRPYSCKQCPKNYSSNENLKHHISSVHEKIKPYSCKQCPKSYSSNQNLKHHISVVHNKNRPYSCKQCSKSFSLNGYLQIHICTVHKGLKLNSCTLCLKRFTTHTSLKNHISLVFTK